MRIKTILFSMAAISMIGSFTSCKSEEDIKVPVETGIDLSNSQTISLTISSPDAGLKTRAGQTPNLTYGTDGLFNFSRTIDKLWYAVYNNGTLLYDSFDAGIPQAIYDSGTETFKLDLQIPRVNDQIKLDEYKVFFFAGNSADKVAKSEISDGIGLDFANKTLYAYPAILNGTTASGDFFSPQQNDYFAKYASLDDIVTGTDEFSGNVTLIRPFCQVSLLTDELVHPAILRTYDSNGKVALQTTPAMFTQKESSSSESLPYGWNYDNDNILLKDLSLLTFSLDSKAACNTDGSLSIPQEITFKSRKMFCVASYLMLAPNARKSYDPGSSKEQFSFALTASGDLHSTDASVKTDVPSGGLKANEKYVLYNKQFDPEHPEEGGGEGIFSTHYVLDVVVDPAWEGNQEIGF